MKKLMHFLARLFPNTASGENPLAVKMFYRMNLVKEFFKKSSSKQWPYYSGNYHVINPKGQIAICTLTSENLFPKETLSEKVAITGTLMTANLGIEKMILNTISNPNIRYLLVCGKDSPIFKAGEAIECLFEYGINQEKRIVNASGHFPVLKNLPVEKINHFLKQIQLINLKDEKQNPIILNTINELKLHDETFETEKANIENDTFTKLKTGGKRIPLDYDTKGFFVITADNKKKEITVKHYYTNNKPGFIVQGHSSESILLAILENDLVSQMSHAGYLGAELTKAETAIRLNLKYIQDQSLKLK